MYLLNMKTIVCLGVFLILIVNACWGQISFQENVKLDKKKSNAAGRTPLYAPTRCKQFELLFPGDQASDWICDCEPTSVYYPETDACYPVFRKGPCEEGQFIVLGSNKIIPECIPNSCKIDGQITINNKCYEFDKAGPCKNAHLSYVLGVDPQTLQVDCVKLSMALQNRFGDEESPKKAYNLTEIELCARGTKRAIQGRCPE